MKSSKELMLASEPYRAMGNELFLERQHAKEELYKYNNLSPSKLKERNQLLKRLFGATGSRFFIEPPFRCDYGYNIEIGENFYANYNCTILDGAKVTIGNHVMFGPNVNLFTAGHPIHFEPRNEGWEYAFPIVIGDHVWIGGNTVVNPGITIGHNTVIGSGSVVTKDIPSNVIAAGNPCRVLRQLTDDDKNYYFKNKRF